MDITGAESLFPMQLLQLKHHRQEYPFLGHWLTIMARWLKAPAPHGFDGRLV
jgi:hypothetical protein